ncbi:MAG: hypothetical protein GY870_05410, partial [archaeon]|nr:hypothetical protein [archaeon]
MIAKITTGTPASVQQIEEFVKNFIEVSEEKCAYLYVPRFWNLEIIIDEKKEEEIRFGCIKNTANKDIKWVFIFEYKFSFLE